MYLSILNVSVDLRIPEQGLVTITPEEVSGSEVLVGVLDGPCLISEVAFVLSVLSMVQFYLDDRDSGQNDGRESNEVGDLLPSGSDGARVLDLFLVSFFECLASLQVGLVSEVVDQWGNTIMVSVTCESLRNELLCSVKHACVC